MSRADSITGTFKLACPSFYGNGATVSAHQEFTVRSLIYDQVLFEYYSSLSNFLNGNLGPIGVNSVTISNDHLFVTPVICYSSYSGMTAVCTREEPLTL